jgi:hypothetical protein
LYRWADDLEQFFVLTHREMAVAQAERNLPGKEFSWRNWLIEPSVASTTY